MNRIEEFDLILKEMYKITLSILDDYLDNEIEEEDKIHELSGFIGRLEAISFLEKLDLKYRGVNK